jgi:hypothetical protein
LPLSSSSKIWGSTHLHIHLIRPVFANHVAIHFTAKTHFTCPYPLPLPSLSYSSAHGVEFIDSYRFIVHSQCVSTLPHLKDLSQKLVMSYRLTSSLSLWIVYMNNFNTCRSSLCCAIGKNPMRRASPRSSNSSCLTVPVQMPTPSLATP